MSKFALSSVKALSFSSRAAASESSVVAACTFTDVYLEGAHIIGHLFRFLRFENPTKSCTNTVSLKQRTTYPGASHAS
jgi:hypothetical protein